MSEIETSSGNGGPTPEQLAELRRSLAELRGEIEARFGQQGQRARSLPSRVLDELVERPG